MTERAKLSKLIWDRIHKWQAMTLAKLVEWAYKAEDTETINADLLAACRHAVKYHRPYVDESGVVCITLQSYAMIKRIVLDHAEGQD